MKKVKAGLALVALAGGAFAAVVPSGGSTVTPTARVVAAAATVHEPWDGCVDVDFTVYLPVSGTTAAIGVTATDGDDGARTFAAKALAGDVSIATSGTYRVTWNMGVDYPDTFVPSLRVRVGATVADFTPDAESGNYLVVDLSAGASAAAYPVSYLVEAPREGWTDAFKTDKLVLRKLPAGSFTMGARATDYPGAQDQNLHTVTFTNELWAGVFEVTQRQWELVKGDRPSFCKNEACYAVRPVERVNYALARGKAAGASWPQSDAVDDDSFLGLLRTRTDGLAFDLPTEAQWEYACRAGTATALNSGADLVQTRQDPALDVLACYGRSNLGASTGGFDKGTTAVGSYLPNAWGLYDMHGNVWEWTRDWFQESLGETAAVDPAGPATGTMRVLRGGGWYTGTTVAAMECMSSYRKTRADPNVSSGSSAYGLRVFATLPPVAPWTGPTSGSGEAAPVFYDGRIIISLPVALDAPDLVVTTGGDNGTEWVATNAPVKVGTHAAQCLSPGTATRKEQTRSVWMETMVNGAGTLSFWWKVDCDWDYESEMCAWDHLAWFVDGEEQARIDGDTDWTRCTVTLTEDAPHTIRWVYEKDCFSDERDCADVGWVDGFTWTPVGREELFADIAVDAEGRVTIDWHPRAAGVYTLLAKRTLAAPVWTPVAESREGTPFLAPSGWKFFKVKMKK